MEEQFNTTRLDSFSNINDYCSRLKSLVDQLANVGNLIVENKMVLQPISGLTKGDYDIIATLIRQTNMLPSFNKACSQLLLEENGRNKQASHTSQALITEKSVAPFSDNISQLSKNHSNNTSGGGGRGGYQGGYRGGRSGQQGRGWGRGRFNNYVSTPNTWQNPWKYPSP